MTHTITNVSGKALSVADAVRFPAAWTSPIVTVNGSPATYTLDSAASRALLTVPLTAQANAQTGIQVVPGVALSGVVTLEGCVPGAIKSQPVTFRFRPQPSGAAFSRTINLNADGSYAITGIPTATYAIAVKGAKWLQVTQVFNPAAVGPAAFNVTLRAGDANNDNFCDTTDFGILVGAYGSDSAVPGSGYDPTADFNCDGFVDTTDFGLLVGNYGAMGDS